MERRSEFPGLKRRLGFAFLPRAAGSNGVDVVVLGVGVCDFAAVDVVDGGCRRVQVFTVAIEVVVGELGQLFRRAVLCMCRQCVAHLGREVSENDLLSNVVDGEIFGLFHDVGEEL